MLQPNPEKIIPKIIGAKVVPIWAVVAILATQIVVNVATQSNDPICRIELQNVHESTHSKRYLEQNDAKVKIKTECNSPQKSTTVSVLFEEEMSDGTFQLVKYRELEARPDPDTPNVVLIKDATVPCNEKGEGIYRARAEGRVRLLDGKLESISGKSPKPMRLLCRIGAK
jgi:hypothetical protein